MALRHKHRSHGGVQVWVLVNVGGGGDGEGVGARVGVVVLSRIMAEAGEDLVRGKQSGSGGSGLDLEGMKILVVVGTGADEAGVFEGRVLEIEGKGAGVGIAFAVGVVGRRWGCDVGAMCWEGMAGGKGAAELWDNGNN